jgi:rubrerythrin
MFHFFAKATGTRRDDQLPENDQRRTFLRYAGASALVTTALVSGCTDHNDVGPQGRGARVAADAVMLGTGDVAVLNYAYALEQLEAAFYVQVIQSGKLTGDELALMTDIRDHEVAHREFFRKALGSAAIKDLTPDFSSIDFSNRLGILAAAQAFEDLGVNAYNGAGKYIKSADYLTLAGKIVSVEARHAAFIRDLLINNNFSNSVDSNALDMAKAPSEVLSIAGKFIKDKIDLTGSGLM